MTFDRLLAQVLELLRREGRMSYRALTRRFPPGEGVPEELKTDISQAKKLTRGVRSPGLVQVGEPSMTPVQNWGHTPRSYTPPHLAHTILTSRSALAGERKHVVVLFADLQDSTALVQAVDPEVLHDVLEGIFALMLAEVHRVEGTINQFTGDGIMALFGAPIAHEDHAIRALHAAMGMQRAFTAYAATCAAPAALLWPCASGCMPVQ